VTGDKTKTLKKIKSRNMERKTKIKPQKNEKITTKELARQMARRTHLETLAHDRLLLPALLLSWDHQLKCLAHVSCQISSIFF